MQTLLPDCSVRKLQPVNADIEKIYAMASQNTLFYQYHPPFVTWQSILDDMSALPPGKTMADKFYIGFFDGAALAAVVDMMRNNGMCHSRLAVDKGNPQSYSFWTKNGYAVCGPEIPNDFSAYIPMQKELTPL